MREYRGNIIIVVMNNSKEPAGRRLVVDIGKNPDVPVRIKENIKRRRMLVNIFAPGEKVSCSEECKIIFFVGGKEAKIFKMV